MPTAMPSVVRPPRRSGFTLLEIMVAIVLTSVVALLAYAAAKVSVESQTRMEAGLRDVRSERALRQTLLDLLHNVRAPRQRGDTSLLLKGDTLWFVAAGAAPLDPEYDWLVELHPGPAGLEFAATSTGRSPSARLGFRVPRVTRWDVSVLPPAGAEWRRDWSAAAVLPRGIAITLWHDSIPLAPLAVRLSDALPSAWMEADPAAE